MEVKIGVIESPRELVLDSDQTQDELEKAVTAALAKDAMLTLVDNKGRKIMIPANRVAYIELAASEQRRVGFGGA